MLLSVRRLALERKGRGRVRAENSGYEDRLGKELGYEEGNVLICHRRRGQGMCSAQMPWRREVM
jgi:hypothetical protein